MENEPSKDRIKVQEQLPLVATPVGTHWREFRVKYLPLLVFSATIFSIWFVWKRVPPSSGLRGVGEGAVSTIASPHDGFIQQIAVPARGWIEAGQPLITIVPFDPGARKAPGHDDTLLLQDGRVLIARAGADVAVVGTSGEVSTVASSACPDPVGLFAAGGRAVLLACRSGNMLRLE